MNRFALQNYENMCEITQIKQRLNKTPLSSWEQTVKAKHEIAKYSFKRILHHCFTKIDILENMYACYLIFFANLLIFLLITITENWHSRGI